MPDLKKRLMSDLAKGQKQIKTLFDQAAKAKSKGKLFKLWHSIAFTLGGQEFIVSTLRKNGENTNAYAREINVMLNKIDMGFGDRNLNELSGKVKCDTDTGFNAMHKSYLKAKFQPEKLAVKTEIGKYCKESKVRKRVVKEVKKRFK